jgi:chaperone BCS1
MDLSAVASSPSYGKAVEAYKKAAATAATVTAYAVLARGMARELLPDELRDAARWAASFLLRRAAPRAPRERRTFVIRRYDGDGAGDNALYEDAREYLASRVDPHSMPRVCLSRRRRRGDDDDDYWFGDCNCDKDGGGGGGGGHVLSMEVGASMDDVFEGVKFTWTSMTDSEGHEKHAASLELVFDAEHTDMVLGRYVPFITASVEEARRRDRTLQIFSGGGGSWRGSRYHHPATFDTLAMDPDLKRSVVSDLGRFLKRREYYRRIGKAWKRGYLLYGPPGTGKSSLVAAMANYLRFNLCDLDLSKVDSNSTLQFLLTSMPDKSILVIEDIDCCFSAMSRVASGGAEKSGCDNKTEENPSDAAPPNEDHFKVKTFLCELVTGLPIKIVNELTQSTRSLSELCNFDVSFECQQGQGITLSGLLNCIDGLWSSSGEERIIIFTTNYKDRLDPALLRPGRMDMHVYMGYCGWEAFKTLAENYFLVDDHPLFPEIQELLTEVEVTPAAVAEMLLRSEDVDVALRGLTEFLQEKKQSK